MANNRSTMCYNSKGLVLILLIINLTDFCQSKAFLEESEKDRGKRSYYAPSAGIHQTYGSQSNSEHWMKGFYEPQVDGQPIYVPALDQPGSYQEFLDAYYKAYTPAWNLATPVPYTYSTKTTYENSDKAVVNYPSGKENAKYAPTAVKESEFSADASSSDDYDASEAGDFNPDIPDKTMTEFSNENAEKFNDENSDFMTSEYDEMDDSEEPVVLESLKKSELPKAKPKETNQYNPVFVKTVKQQSKPKDKTNQNIVKTKQKTKPQNNQYAEQDKVETKQQLEDDKYEPTVVKRVKQKPKTNPKDDQYDEPPVKTAKQKPKTNPKDDQYDEPPLKTVKQKPKTNPKDDQYDEPPLKTVKQKPKTNPKDDQYDEPPVKTVKQKPKTNPKDDQYDEPPVKTVKQKPKTNPKDDQYDEPPVKTVKQKPKTNPKDDQYDEPPVKTVKQKPKTNPKDDQYDEPPVKTVKQKPKTNPKDNQYDEPPVKTVKQKPKTNPKDDQYDKPPVKTVKQKPKTNPKDDQYDEPPVKTVKQKPKTKPKNDQYDEPAVIKTVKQKPQTSVKISKNPSKPKPQLNSDYENPEIKQKKKTNTSKLKYGDRMSQGNRKKSKGKRRKQYSKTNQRTIAETIENKNLNTEIDSEIPQLSKKDGELDPSTDKQIEIKESVIETDVKEPIKTKEKIGQSYPQYDQKSTKIKSDTKNKPVKANVIVKTQSQQRPVKITAEEAAKDSKDKSVHENIKYPEIHEDNLSKQLNDQNEDLTNDESVNTDSLLSELNSESTLNATEIELPAKESDSISTVENDQNSKISTSIESVVEQGSKFPNANDFRGLSSMNSNIWSMLFNPKAEQNRLKLKRCITRSNETGFCTYIQNCEVPQIATSLEQLLNNACVIDDIFIGVCCPEFPVETVKVHWDQTPSDFDNQIEDEFGNNAEGELIKSWLNGYEEFLTNLLISFSLADCGVRSNESSELQSWPWKAPLVSMSNGKIFCGGVVVSEDHVLTAAHCTTKIPKNQILVRLGQYDDGSGDDYAVVEIKRHAQYNPRTMQNDVALLKLGRRIMNDAHIGIACLPDEDDDEDEHDGETATLLGWRGIFGTKSRDPEFLEVISNKECEKKLGRKVPSTTLCTETRKESERTCNADSGAPLVIEHDDKYEVIGILSWNRNDCDRRFPSTFSRVSSYTGWIKNHIA